MEIGANASVAIGHATGGNAASTGVANRSGSAKRRTETDHVHPEAVKAIVIETIQIVSAAPGDREAKSGQDADRRGTRSAAIRIRTAKENAVRKRTRRERKRIVNNLKLWN